jgi:hypothetical protein
VDELIDQPASRSIAVCAQQLDVFRVHEQALTAGFDLIEDAELGKLLEIDRCRLALSQACVDDIGDATVRLHEQQLA